MRQPGTSEHWTFDDILMNYCYFYLDMKMVIQFWDFKKLIIHPASSQTFLSEVSICFLYCAARWGRIWSTPGDCCPARHPPPCLRCHSNINTVKAAGDIRLTVLMEAVLSPGTNMVISISKSLCFLEIYSEKMDEVTWFLGPGWK